MIITIVACAVIVIVIDLAFFAAVKRGYVRIDRNHVRNKVRDFSEE